MLKTQQASIKNVLIARYNSLIKALIEKCQKTEKAVQAIFSDVELPSRLAFLCMLLAIVYQVFNSIFNYWDESQIFNQTLSSRKSAYQFSFNMANDISNMIYAHLNGLQLLPKEQINGLLQDIKLRITEMRNSDQSEEKGKDLTCCQNLSPDLFITIAINILQVGLLMIIYWRRYQIPVTKANNPLCSCHVKQFLICCQKCNTPNCSLKLQMNEVKRKQQLQSESNGASHLSLNNQFQGQQLGGGLSPKVLQCDQKDENSENDLSNKLNANSNQSSNSGISSPAGNMGEFSLSSSNNSNATPLHLSKFSPQQKRSILFPITFNSTNNLLQSKPSFPQTDLFDTEESIQNLQMQLLKHKQHSFKIKLEPTTNAPVKEVSSENEEDDSASKKADSVDQQLFNNCIDQPLEHVNSTSSFKQIEEELKSNGLDSHQHKKPKKNNKKWMLPGGFRRSTRLMERTNQLLLFSQLQSTKPDADTLNLAESLYNIVDPAIISGSQSPSRWGATSICSSQPSILKMKRQIDSKQTSSTIAVQQNTSTCQRDTMNQTAGTMLSIQSMCKRVMTKFSNFPREGVRENEFTFTPHTGLNQGVLSFQQQRERRFSEKAQRPGGMITYQQYQKLLKNNSYLHLGCKRQIKKLEKQLTNTKIFLNMVIHDLRNPTNSIEFALKEVIKMLKLNDDQEKGDDEEMFLKELKMISSQHKHNVLNEEIKTQAAPNTPYFTSKAVVQRTANLQQLSNMRSVPRKLDVHMGGSVQFIQPLPQLANKRSKTLNRESKKIHPELQAEITLNADDSLNRESISIELQHSNPSPAAADTSPLGLGSIKSNSLQDSSKLGIRNKAISGQDFQKITHAVNTATVKGSHLFEVKEVILAEDQNSNINAESKSKLPIINKDSLLSSKPVQRDQLCSNSIVGQQVAQDFSFQKHIEKHNTEKTSQDVIKQISIIVQKIQDEEEQKEQHNIEEDNDTMQEFGPFPSEKIANTIIDVRESKVKTNDLNKINDIYWSGDEEFKGGVNNVASSLHARPQNQPVVKSRRFIQLTDIVPIDQVTESHPLFGELNQVNHQFQEKPSANFHVVTEPNNERIDNQDRYYETPAVQNQSLQQQVDPQQQLNEFVANQERVCLNMMPSRDSKSRSQMASLHQQSEVRIHLQSNNVEDINIRPKNQSVNNLNPSRLNPDTQRPNYDVGTPIRSIKIENVEQSSGSKSVKQEDLHAIISSISSQQSHDLDEEEKKADLSMEACRSLVATHTQAKIATPSFSEAKHGQQCKKVKTSITDKDPHGIDPLFFSEEGKHPQGILTSNKLTDLELSQVANVFQQTLYATIQPNDRNSMNAAIQSLKLNEKLATQLFPKGILGQSNNNLNIMTMHEEARAINQASLIQLSHELKRRGYLLKPEEKKLCEQYLRNSLLSSTMLINLINDLLDLAKIENSQFNFNTTQFNLHDVIQKAIDTLEFSAQQKQISVEYKFDEESVEYLMEIAGDDNRYLQILLNFLSNALKFTNLNGKIIIQTKVIDTQSINQTPVTGGNNKKSNNQLNKAPYLLDKQELLNAKGRTRSLERIPDAMLQLQKQSKKRFNFMISMNHGSKGIAKKRTEDEVNNDKKQLEIPQVETVVRRKNQEKYIKFEIRIKDSGVGISPENIGKLFMNFSKLEEHAEGNKRGTGLGLSICKSLIERMGGSVNVESELGVGTTFIMSLQTKCKVATTIQKNTWMRKYRQRFNPEEEDVGCNLNRLGIDHLQSQISVHSARQGGFGNSPIKCGEDDTDYFQYMAEQEPEEMEMSQEQCVTFHNSVNQSSQVQSSGLLAPPFFPEGGSKKRNPYIPLNLTQQQHEQALQRVRTNLKRPSQSPEVESPMRTPHLFRRMRNSLSAMQNEGERDGQEQPGYQVPERQRYKVLVANDDIFQLTIVSTIMQSCGLEVYTAENGLVAVQQHFQAIQNTGGQGIGFDAIALDLDMPIMNGFEACRRICMGFGSEDLQKIIRIASKQILGRDVGLEDSKNAENIYDNEADPLQGDKPLIIALSGLITDSVIEKGKQCGFDDFIETPLTKDKVRDKIIFKLEEKYSAMDQLYEDEDEEQEENGEDETDQLMTVHFQTGENSTPVHYLGPETVQKLRAGGNPTIEVEQAMSSSSVGMIDSGIRVAEQQMQQIGINGTPDAASNCQQ